MMMIVIDDDDGDDDWWIGRDDDDDYHNMDVNVDANRYRWLSYQTVLISLLKKLTSMWDVLNKVILE